MKGIRVPPRTREKFLEHLARTGNVTQSAEASGFTRKTAYKHRREDPEFAAAWDDAFEQATDALESEARRRAYDGVKRPVYQGGELVGYVQEYSDQLMLALLKAHRRGTFGDKQQVEHSGALTLEQLVSGSLTVAAKPEEQ